MSRSWVFSDGSVGVTGTAESPPGSRPAPHGVGLSAQAVVGTTTFPAGAGSYLSPWRMYTAYADEDAVPPLEDVVRFARWRRETMGL